MSKSERVHAKNRVAIVAFSILLACGLSCRAAATEPSFPDLTAKADSGDARVMFELGIDYQQGKGADVDYSKSLQWL